MTHPTKAAEPSLRQAAEALLGELDRFGAAQSHNAPFVLARERLRSALGGEAARDALVTEAQERGFYNKPASALASEPRLPGREEIARVILGPSSSWNTHFPGIKKLEEWSQYPAVTRAFAKADAIMALFSPPVVAETGEAETTGFVEPRSNAEYRERVKQATDRYAYFSELEALAAEVAKLKERLP